jgi:putative transposase
LNRGNYRAPVFASAGAKEAFVKCLHEACVKASWVLHAYVLMSNHYHLAIETPDGNLVDGMKWLQSTFSNRYNRYRDERGHVFQGRYKAIVVEDFASLGAVAHYIHLNPIRAKLTPIERLANYRDSSYFLLQEPRHRPRFFQPRTCLEAAGDLADTPAGRKNYAEYLAWLSENEPAQKRLKFITMSKGWALGSVGFKKALIEDHKKAVESAQTEDGTAEMKELIWEEAVNRALKRLGRGPSDIAKDRKSADWKVAIAAHLKSTTTASNPWLGRRLQMGAPAALCRYVTELRAGTRSGANLLAKINK